MGKRDMCTEAVRKWEIAQDHELDYINKGKNKDWGIPHSLDYWKSFLHLDNIDGKGLEVGCGPNGVYRFAPNIIGVDPIDFSDQCDNFVQGIGEDLPFESKSIDFVICCNVIDHAIDPAKVISEMFRVSNRVILWAYVWPEWLAVIMRRLDSMHPYHFTKDDVNRLTSDYWIEKRHIYSFMDVHVKYAKSMVSLIKLFGGHILGVRGLLLHLVPKGTT